MMNPVIGEAPTRIQNLPTLSDNKKVYEQVLHLLNVALMDMRAGDLEVAEDEILEAQKLIYELTR